jgi:hypothetical protein
MNKVERKQAMNSTGTWLRWFLWSFSQWPIFVRVANLHHKLPVNVRGAPHRWTLADLGAAVLTVGDYTARWIRRIVSLRLHWPYDPAGSLGQLGLARAFALRGEKAASQEAYRAFLALWKDADADTPFSSKQETNT